MNERSTKSLIFADTDNGGVVHIANIKGGVGKSTVATNLAASLAKKGPTLIIDLDVQGSASVALGKDTAEVSCSSWELFRRRFSSSEQAFKPKILTPFSSLNRTIANIESHFFGQIVGNGSLTTVVNKVQPCLDLIAANADLFKTTTFFHYQNFLYNLRICRLYYKYVVLDTPSVWNTLTRLLYLNSDLNLIPVTLNALSTKSLRDYLLNVKRLVSRKPSVRIRIVKNEVFGSSDSKVKGKVRTMNENRKYLDSLCEQVAVQSNSGTSFLPQSIMFDLEIPESATVRDAQDEGKSVHEFQQYSAVTKAFDELAKRVQYVFNSPSNVKCRKTLPFAKHVATVGKVLAAVLLLFIFKLNDPVADLRAPRPMAPQQLQIPDGGIVHHTFTTGENVYKVAKYCISRFRAKVPSYKEVGGYVNEIVSIYNMTRISGEPRIDGGYIPAGVTISFYPPSNVTNPNEKQLIPVYRFFMETVKDKFAYVTGDWCERGTGGGQPHYGIDVAANIGTEIVTPIAGDVVIKSNGTAGRVLGVAKDGYVVFFCHMDKRYFKDGDKIKAGTVIGTVGLTGRTSGPHVHIGYAIKSQSNIDLSFGNSRYRITDPKLFFYRQMYIDGLEQKKAPIESHKEPITTVASY